MPDLRYHLISLISVFLALAIGVLLGVAMADRGVISDRVQAEITSIERDVARQNRELGEQNRRIAEQEAMLSGMSEAMISGRLRGENVAIVAGPFADGEVARAVQSDLETAGARLVTFETVPDPEPIEVTGPEPTVREGFATRLEVDYTGFARGVLGRTGDAGEPPGTIVFVGGGRIAGELPPQTREALDAATEEMLGVWLEAGIQVVGAQPTEPGHSDVGLFQSVGVASVDNADEAAGRAAIIECAATNCEGSYGTRETASEAFPPPD